MRNSNFVCKYAVILFLICLSSVLIIANKPKKQRNYSLTPTKLDKLVIHNDWFIVPAGSFRINKINRTTAVIKATLELLQDLPGNTKCTLQAYQKMPDGTYGRSANKMQEKTLCEFIETDTILWPSLVEVSNLPSKCPVKKKKYVVKNFDINSCDLPDELPNPNEWKVELKVIHPDNGKVLLRAHTYATINRDAKVG